MPIVNAVPVGQVMHRKGPEVTSRLMIGKVVLEECWPCFGREFTRPGEVGQTDLNPGP